MRKTQGIERKPIVFSQCIASHNSFQLQLLVQKNRSKYSIARYTRISEILSIYNINSEMKNSRKTVTLRKTNSVPVAQRARWTSNPKMVQKPLQPPINGHRFCAPTHHGRPPVYTVYIFIYIYIIFLKTHNDINFAGAIFLFKVHSGGVCAATTQPSLATHTTKKKKNFFTLRLKFHFQGTWYTEIILHEHQKKLRHSFLFGAVIKIKSNFPQ